MSYTIKGGLVGLILLFIIFLPFWIDGAQSHLREMTIDYEKSQQCMSCKQDLDSLFECAINNCDIYSGSNCTEFFHESYSGDKKDFTFRHCGFKDPKYVGGKTILVNKPKYSFKPFYLQSFFTLGSFARGFDTFGTLAYIPPLFIITLLLPFIGALIGWMYKRIKK